MSSTQFTALLQLTGIFSQINKRVDRALSVHGMSYSEFLVLHHLAITPSQTTSRIELAEATNLTASGITRLLNPMQKNRLVEKEKNSRDARVSLVKLTSAGLENYQNALTTCGSFSENLFSNLTDNQLASLKQTLEKIA